MFLLDLNASDIGTENGFCHNTAVVWQFLGRIVLILKIVIPVILIVFRNYWTRKGCSC